MKRIFAGILPLVVIPGMAAFLLAWGFKGHQQINRLAVYTLPPDLFGFYKEHIEHISKHAVDADKRRYAVQGEAERHFIDLDQYGDQPFDSIPRSWTDAVALFSEDSLRAHGIVPWHVIRVHRQLISAFRDKDIERILRHSADLGHYIGDAHVPLHCTRNYNGQLSGQHGIHGLWESRLPELFSDGYDGLTGRAVYIKNTEELIWEVLRESFAAKDSVLTIEEALDREFAHDQKYSYEERGGRLIRVYSRRYSTAYHNRLNGMVERRMRMAVYRLGCFWYTAWADAGMPDLPSGSSFQPGAKWAAELDSLDRKYLEKRGHSDACED